jgi:hypothetical protein
MDYVNIGAIGFAQLGTEDYHEKRLIEKQVITEYLKNDIFKIPEEFNQMSDFSIKRFPYETSSYDELVLNYSSDIVNQWSIEHDQMYNQTDFEEDQDPDTFETKYTRFWDWVNFLEKIDLDTEELMEKCRLKYAENLKLSVSYKKLPPLGNTDLNQAI